MAIAALSKYLLALISFLLSISLFILFLSLLLKNHKKKGAPLCENPPPCQIEPLQTSSTEEEPPKEEDKKRRKRRRKKQQQSISSESGDELKKIKSTAQIEDDEMGTVSGANSGNAGTSYPLFPFYSVTNSLQRKIKSNYDGILRSANHSTALSVAQVLLFLSYSFFYVIIILDI
jgi:hypothetical protein